MLCIRRIQRGESQGGIGTDGYARLLDHLEKLNQGWAAEMDVVVVSFDCACFVKEDLK